MIGMTAVWLGIVLVMLIFMLIIGTIVYKDAKAYDLNPWLWTLVAILTPNLIGIVIYLVVRSNQQKKYTCSNCNAEIKGEYDICPSCQATFEDTCEKCRHKINEQMTYCPYCGAKVDEHMIPRSANKLMHKTNFNRSLVVAGSICFIVIMMLFGTIFTGKTFFNSSVAIMSFETTMGNHLKASFYYQTGRDRIRVKKQIGDTLRLRGNVKVEKGEISLTVKDPQGRSIFNESYTENQEIEEDMILHKEGRYTIEVHMQSARGGYDIKVD